MCLLTTTTHKCGHRTRATTRTEFGCTPANFNFNRFFRTATGLANCKTCIEKVNDVIRRGNGDRVREWVDSIERAGTPGSGPGADF